MDGLAPSACFPSPCRTLDKRHCFIWPTDATAWGDVVEPPYILISFQWLEKRQSAEQRCSVVGTLGHGSHVSAIELCASLSLFSCEVSRASRLETRSC